MMRVRVVTEFELCDLNEQPLQDGRIAGRIAAETANVINNRLMGEGFLPEDVLCVKFSCTGTVRTEFRQGSHDES